MQNRRIITATGKSKVVFSLPWLIIPSPFEAPSLQIAKVKESKKRCNLKVVKISTEDQKQQKFKLIYFKIDYRRAFKNIGTPQIVLEYSFTTYPVLFLQICIAIPYLQ